MRGSDEAPAASAYVPSVTAPLRLVVFLHGAGGEASRSLGVFRPFADSERRRVLGERRAGRRLGRSGSSGPSPTASGCSCSRCSPRGPPGTPSWVGTVPTYATWT